MSIYGMHGRFNGIKGLFKLFEPKARSILGIDISSTTVKILEISGRSDVLIVKNYGCEALPSHAMDGHVIKDIDAVARCIKKVMSRLHTPCKQVALAIPDASIISKVIQINDGLNDSEMEEFILSEADKYIPYPINEIYLDFEVLGYVEKSPTLLDLLIVASRADNVNQRVETVTRAGLDVLVVDVESFAVERAAPYLTKTLPTLGHDKIVAIIDIGATYTHLFVMQGVKLVYSREEKFGGKQLIELIAEYYALSLENASLAQAHGRLPTDYESKILYPFKENIIVHVKRALQFFYSTNQNECITHILLAGGLAKLPGLLSLIQKQLGITTTVANPFVDMLLSNSVDCDSISMDAPTLMVSCGLALRTIE